MDRGKTAKAAQTDYFFKLLVKNVRDYAIFGLDAEGRIVTWNEGARRIFGYEHDDIVGADVTKLSASHQGTDEGVARALDLARQTGRVEYEAWRKRKDGTNFWADVVITPLIDDSNELVGYAEVIRDLSERREAAEKLRRAQETLDLIVGAVKDYAIFLLNPEGYITTWNEGARNIKGYSEDEIIGKHFSIFYPEEAVVAKHPEFELEEAMRHGRYEEQSWRIRKDGTQFWASVTITPVYDENRKLIGFLKVTRDLSGQKAFEEQLKATRDEALEARDEADRANKLKSQFVANVSHEIRTPMAGIIGMAEQLATDETLGEDERDAAQHILISAQRLLDVLNDLLDFSKLEAGRLSLDENNFSLLGLINEVVASISVPAEKKHLVVEKQIDPGIPDGLFGDDGKIRQVLLNLAHNAVKFTRQGGIKVIAKLHEQADETIKIRFEVTDTGIGIRDEAKGLLFQPFAQADKTTHRRYGGTGLGLSIAKGFIGLMNGDIGYDSVFGQGTTFWFVVPFKKATNG